MCVLFGSYVPVPMFLPTGLSLQPATLQTSWTCNCASDATCVDLGECVIPKHISTTSIQTKFTYKVESQVKAFAWDWVSDPWPWDNAALLCIIYDNSVVPVITVS